jgi:hypothetical protein
MQARHGLLLLLLASALLAGSARGPIESADDDEDEYERSQDSVEPAHINADGLRTTTITVFPTRPTKPRAPALKAHQCSVFCKNT